MTIQEKYKEYRDIFFHYFINKGMGTESATNVPLSEVDFSKRYGAVGDGTIELAHYMLYLYSGLSSGEFKVSDLQDCVDTLSRLVKNAEAIGTAGTNMFYKYEPGFFTRDDIYSWDAKKFNLDTVNTSTTMGVERINEDPCHSMFVSQDQLWHLMVPMIKIGLLELANKGKDMLGYVVDNKHKIYNPYYSASEHDRTFLVPFKVSYYERTDYKNNRLKYGTKVLRGANNWYFSYGFKKAYNACGGSTGTFLSSLWYKPFIFMADRLWEPIAKLFGIEVKNTSYYSMGTATGAWYWTKNSFEKRLVKRFNKSVKKALKEGKFSKEDLFMPHLVFLVSEKNTNKVDIENLKKWLNNYPEPKLDGKMESPLEFLMLYNWVYNN